MEEAPGFRYAINFPVYYGWSSYSWYDPYYGCMIPTTGAHIGLRSLLLQLVHTDCVQYKHRRLVGTQLLVQT